MVTCIFGFGSFWFTLSVLALIFPLVAKKQKILSNMFFRGGIHDEEREVLPLTSSGSTKKSENAIEAAKREWKDSWYLDYDWLEFNATIGRVFCKICREKGGRSVFAKTGSVNIKVSAFKDHGRSDEHKSFVWAMQSGEKVMVKAIAQANKTCDEAVFNLFRIAYYIGKNTIPFNKFPPLCELFVRVKACITEKLYHDEKACADMIFCISKVIKTKVLDRVKNARFFGIMIDESTDIAVTSHLVVFASFFEEGIPVSVFLGLLFIADGHKDAAVMYERLTNYLVKDCGLDFNKFIGFGSDGAATMVGKKNGVSTRLKKLNPFLTSVHCVAHRTNLAALEAAKHDSCKVISSDVDKVLNKVAFYFKKSCQRRVGLQAFQSQLLDAQKSLKRYHKIRWLSRWQAVTSLCDSLESVITYFRDVPHKKDDKDAPYLYEKLRSFKMIYCLYFLADILHMLSLLSRLFQYKFVDVSSIGSIVRAEITQIRMLFIEERSDLNVCTFNEDSGYHVIPDFGPEGGYLKRLSSQIRGNWYHGVEMIRDRIGRDLEEALDFQKAYAQAVIDALESRFEDNGIMNAFKVLNPCNMPSKSVGLGSWGVVDLEVLCSHYGKEQELNGKKFSPLINPDAVKREFFSFKIQATTDWMQKNFRDLWSMISWNSSLQVKYSNLLILAEIASVQCVSTASCERAFSVQNCIKSKFRNRLKTQHLECVMRIALEGPQEGCDSLLLDAIGLWKNTTKFRYLYSDPEKYLIDHAITNEMHADHEEIPNY